MIPSLEQLRQQSFDDIEKYRHKPTYEFIKRVFDMVAAITGLILLSWLGILLIILIKIDSPGSAFFIHQRVGKAGKIFTIYKFRTMFKNVPNQEFAPESAKDPRVTRLGHWLRRTSLDELPQLINILKGEMSLIGPRPEMPFIVEKYTALERKRLIIKPGLTGLWQVSGRKDLPLHKNLEYDFYYIKHRSLTLDSYIIFKTFGVVFTGKGAY